jgi:hypothetical protein
MRQSDGPTLTTLKPLTQTLDAVFGRFSAEISAKILVK